MRFGRELVTGDELFSQPILNAEQRHFIEIAKVEFGQAKVRKLIRTLAAPTARSSTIGVAQLPCRRISGNRAYA
jgi:hypothetical protein